MNEYDAIWDHAESKINTASDSSTLEDSLSDYDYGSTADDLTVFENLVNMLWSNDYAAEDYELSGKYWDSNV